MANYEQDSKIQFVIDAVYAFAYALDALKSTVCPTWKGVCPAMSSYDGGEFYKKYLLAVDFKGKFKTYVFYYEYTYTLIKNRTKVLFQLGLYLKLISNIC